MSGVMFDASVTAQPMKKDYAPPLLTIQKVVLENAVATPVSVQTLNGITQENDWGNESPLAPSEGDIWVDF
jgi:hypothetical protein